MSDIVERLRVYASDDHERLCEGRCYTCSCGYDDKRDPLLTEAAAEVERLRAALDEWLRDYEDNTDTDTRLMVEKTRAALASQPAQEKPAYTEGHCENKKAPGGCQLHNLQCGYPECDRREGRRVMSGLDFFDDGKVPPMTDITIPAAALAAARLAVAKAIIEDRDGIEAACLAMLKAWPGMWSEQKHVGVMPDVFRWNLILPLTEDTDDK